MLGLKVIQITKRIPLFEAYVSRNHLPILKDLSNIYMKKYSPYEWAYV